MICKLLAGNSFFVSLSCDLMRCGGMPLFNKFWFYLVSNHSLYFVCVCVFQLKLCFFEKRAVKESYVKMVVLILVAGITLHFNWSDDLVGECLNVSLKLWKLPLLC